MQNITHTCDRCGSDRTQQGPLPTVNVESPEKPNAKEQTFQLSVAITRMVDNLPADLCHDCAKTLVKTQAVELWKYFNGQKSARQGVVQADTQGAGDIPGDAGGLGGVEDGGAGAGGSEGGKATLLSPKKGKKA